MASRAWTVVAMVAAYAAGLGAYWLWPRNAGQDAPANVHSAPEPGNPPPRRAGRAVPAPVVARKVHTVQAELSEQQEMRLEHPEEGTRTWAAANSAILDLQRVALERNWREHGWLPQDCATDETPAAAFEASVSVAASADQVVVSGYRVTDATLPGDVRDCLERYFAGEATIDRREGAPPFLALETAVSREQIWLARPVTPPASERAP